VTPYERAEFCEWYDTAVGHGKHQKAIRLLRSEMHKMSFIIDENTTRRVEGTSGPFEYGHRLGQRHRMPAYLLR
jgi:hypothetical protein